METEGIMSNRKNKPIIKCTVINVLTEIRPYESGTVSNKKDSESINNLLHIVKNAMAEIKTKFNGLAEKAKLSKVPR